MTLRQRDLNDHDLRGHLAHAVGVGLAVLHVDLEDFGLTWALFDHMRDDRRDGIDIDERGRGAFVCTFTSILTGLYRKISLIHL